MAAIDVQTDRLVPVQELCTEILGKRISPATLWRWIRKGTRGSKLQAKFVGGGWYSTRAAFAEFVERQTAAALATSPDEDDAPAERDEATMRRLKAAGLV